MLNNFRPLTLAALLAVTAPAGFAGTITFDTLTVTTTSGIDLNTQFQASDGVSFKAADGTTVKALSTKFPLPGSVPTTPPSGTIFASGSVFDILIDDSRSYDSISLFGRSVDSLTDGDIVIWYEPNTVVAGTLTNALVSGAALATQSLPVPSDGGTGNWFETHGTVSGRITKISVNAPAGFLFDSITFGPTDSGNVVPEPQSFALAGLALLVAGVSSRRRASVKRQA